jgi:hypothetical protein
MWRSGGGSGGLTDSSGRGWYLFPTPTFPLPLNFPLQPLQTGKSRPEDTSLSSPTAHQAPLPSEYSEQDDVCSDGEALERLKPEP